MVLQRALDWLLDLIKTNPGLALSLAMGISVGILSGWAVDNMEGSIVWNNGKITINIKGGLISIENLTICFSNCNNSDNHVEQHNHYYPPPIVPTSAPIIIYPTQAPTLLSATVTPTLQATSVVTPSVPSTISTGTPSGSVPTQPPIITVVQNGNPTDTGIIVAGGHRETATQQPVDQPGGSTEVPETPTPETPAPETPAPETPTPETPTPETPTPETPTPETPTPETPTPETPTPETPTPFMRIFGVDDEGGWIYRKHGFFPIDRLLQSVAVGAAIFAVFVSLV